MDAVCSRVPRRSATGRGTSDCADEVTLSLKGAKNPTRGRKLRSTGTKAGTRVARIGEPPAELEKELEARTRELSEAREQLGSGQFEWLPCSGTVPGSDRLSNGSDPKRNRQTSENFYFQP